MQLFGLNTELEIENYDLYSEYEFQDIEISSALESIDYINNQLGLEDFKDGVKKVKEFIIKIWNKIMDFIKGVYNKIKNFFKKGEEKNKSNEDKVSKMEKDLNNIKVSTSIEENNKEVTVILYKDLIKCLKEATLVNLNSLHEETMTLDLQKIFENLDFSNLEDIKKTSEKLIKYNKGINEYLNYLNGKPPKMVSMIVNDKESITGSKDEIKNKIRADINTIKEMLEEYKNDFSNSRKKAKEVLDIQTFKNDIEEKISMLNNDTSNEVVLELQTLLKELRVLTSQLAMYFTKRENTIITFYTLIIRHYEIEIDKIK